MELTIIPANNFTNHTKDQQQRTLQKSNANSTTSSTSLMQPLKEPIFIFGKKNKRNATNIAANDSSSSSSSSFSSISSSTADVKPYSCPKCEQTFSRPHNLKSHLATHSSARPFQCDHCQLHFRRQHDLKRHQKLHTGERPHVCKICSRSFARSDALNRHQRVDGDIPCSMAYRHCIMTTSTSSSSLQNHSKSPTLSPTHSPTARPTVPELHIAHPASEPIPTNVNSSLHCDNQELLLSTTSTPSSVSSSSSSSSVSSISTSLASPPSYLPLLPSPSALSSLPVSNTTNLSPMYALQQTSSNTNNSITVATSTKLSSPSPSSSSLISSPTHPRTLPIPSPTPTSPTLPTINNNNNTMMTQQHWEQEISQLKQQHAKEMDRLICEIHDLQVENNLLRSLVLGKQQQSDLSLDSINSNSSQKRSRHTNVVDSPSSLDSLSFNKKKSKPS
ncbi:uncharacterized protein BX664DRAFT_300064 [Halteromyces radiatus]|uniref:uncharacterized protein n=1 Tax=Halteromyces radiatus TaxID=101107 RepID=UPI00221F919A|nr:uncharacterized protein BX664DRAFT_300064 [Halteromyces radiatus]KAI8084658.1 hypothetical protein BX664DRAFT_300064 [Halteromyces radiatus]